MHFTYELVHDDEQFSFVEKISFDPARADFTRAPEAVLTAAFDTLFLILGISYWKLFCSKEIKLETIKLSPEQAKFWNTVYTKGLGEFFYKNNIDFRGLVNFPVSDVQKQKVEVLPKVGKSLVLWGGGKDSIVTTELLKSCGKEFDLFSLNEYEIQKKVAGIAGKSLLIVRREIDPQLFELNQRTDVYNGHVPISCIYSTTAVLAALLYGYDSVLISNEESANYGNMEYLGEYINHQWSKSHEFEKMLQQYLANFVTPSIIYFSFIRAFHEIKIVEFFSKYPHYFESFSSCNKNFKIEKTEHGLWCGECPKCAFVFALLSAFVPKAEVLKIFGKNLFAEKSLQKTYRELLGLEEIKPFDCVGTPEETQLAFYLARQKGGYEGDVIMHEFVAHFEKVFPEIKMSRETLLEKNATSLLPADFNHCL